MIGPKEAAVRALRAARLSRTPPAPPAKPKEPTVKKSAKTKPRRRNKPARKPQPPKIKARPKKAARAPAEAPPAAGKRPDGLRVGSKEAHMLDIVLAAAPVGGVTEAYICNALGWKRCRVTLGRVCDKAGAKLTSEGVGAERKWSATMPAAKAA